MIVSKLQQAKIQWEPVSSDEIHAMFDEVVFKEELEIPVLSKEARILLREAMKDAAGQILVINLLEGTEIQTNNVIMNKERLGRDAVIWMNAINELRNKQLLIPVGNKNEIFQLTKFGYEISERIYIYGGNKMIFKYDIKIPLTYNRFAIRSNNPDSELRYEIDQLCEEEFKIIFRTYEVPSYGDGYDFEDVVKVRLYKTDTNNGQTGNIRQKDVSELMCEINGMLVDDEIYARKFSEDIIDRICKRLSLVFIKHNDNRHLYQPRVEAMWSKAVFNRCEYVPFVAAKHKALEKIDGNNKTIHLEDHISFHESMYCISKTSISCDEIKIREWLSKEDDVVEFLMNEYHSALGTENIKSKFFHLFAIIEFCEKEYEKHNGSSRLLSDEEVDMVIEKMEKQIDAKNRERIISILKNDLMKANDIGRVRKLENILKWMGIEEYKQFGSDKAIDKKLLDGIIKLRNKSFHGTKENAGDVEKKYADAVEILLYIDEKILDFLMKSPHQDKTDGVNLIYGKK